MSTIQRFNYCNDDDKDIYKTFVKKGSKKNYKEEEEEDKILNRLGFFVAGIL